MHEEELNFFILAQILFKENTDLSTVFRFLDIPSLIVVLRILTHKNVPTICGINIDFLDHLTNYDFRYHFCLTRDTFTVY